jgi:hypothetical protein
LGNGLTINRDDQAFTGFGASHSCCQCLAKLPNAQVAHEFSLA